MSENNRQNMQEQQQDIGELMKVRRDKLAQLQEEGENPFDVTTYNQEYHTDEIIEKVAYVNSEEYLANQQAQNEARAHFEIKEDE